MTDLVIARVIHVLAVVIWIGGVAIVTTVILPIARASGAKNLLDTVERRFVWQARLSTLLVGATGFYMVAKLSAWDRFQSIAFWWIHAMVAVWLIFSAILFLGERFITKSNGTDIAQHLRRVQILHWILFGAAIITTAAAVAGSQGISLVP